MHYSAILETRKKSGKNRRFQTRKHTGDFGAPGRLLHKNRTTDKIYVRQRLSVELNSTLALRVRTSSGSCIHFSKTEMGLPAKLTKATKEIAKETRDQEKRGK